MSYICQVCDRSLVENPLQHEHYLDISHKKNDKNLYIKFTIDNFNLDELDKIINKLYHYS